MYVSIQLVRGISVPMCVHVRVDQCCRMLLLLYTRVIVHLTDVPFHCVVTAVCAHVGVTFHSTCNLDRLTCLFTALALSFAQTDLRTFRHLSVMVPSRGPSPSVRIRLGLGSKKHADFWRGAICSIRSVLTFPNTW